MIYLFNIHGGEVRRKIIIGNLDFKRTLTPTERNKRKIIYTRTWLYLKLHFVKYDSRIS